MTVMIAGTTVAQDPLVEARNLYNAAAYEDALVRLDTLQGSARGNERVVDQYRAFCLIALGRTAQAEHAIEAVVTAAPSYHPEESPRIAAAFRDVRRRMLPDIIQRRYADAKAAFDRHDSTAALAGFQDVLTLLADADIAALVGVPPLSELRTLAIGFRDLSTPPSQPATLVLLPSTLPPAVSEPARLPAAVIYGITDPKVAPPVAVRESWTALNDVFAVRTGVVEVVIDESGDVQLATMTVPVNSVYDRLALSLARHWKYRPATLNGVPVRFRKVIALDRTTPR